MNQASLESYDRHTYTMHTFKRLVYHRVAADGKKIYMTLITTYDTTALPRTCPA